MTPRGYHKNLIIGFSVGGQVPGSLPIHSRTIFEDGIQIPICKLYSRGEVNEAIREVPVHFRTIAHDAD